MGGVDLSGLQEAVDQRTREDLERIVKKDDPWRHRSQGMKCSTCMWYVEKVKTFPQGTDNPNPIGRCRKRAPTMDGYPVVYPTDWCGDHKLDETKL